MKEIQEIKELTALIFKIDYFNREGGRYAYLQFLYYSREILVRLQQLQLDEKVRRMQIIREELNEQVGMKFEKPQQIIFVGKQIEINELLQNLENELKQRPLVFEEFHALKAS